MSNTDNVWCVYIHIVPKEVTNYDYDKYYVGITGDTPENRWKNGNGYNAGIFKKAIKKYGWKNIKHKIVATGLSKTEACIMEKELIKKYNSFGKHGYNATEGGEGRGYYINCHQPAYDTWYRMVKRYERTQKDIDRYAKKWEDPSKFSEWAVENGWKPNAILKKKNKKKHYTPSNCYFYFRPVYTYNGETKSLSEWSKTTGLTQKTIEGRLLRNPNFEHAIHEFIENGCKKIKTKNNKYQNDIPILQYDSSNNLIAKYKNIIECANANNTDPKYITNAINSRNGLWRGYKFIKNKREQAC